MNHELNGVVLFDVPQLPGMPPQADYVARCVCGWQSPPMSTRGAAQDAHTNHLKAAA